MRTLILQCTSSSHITSLTYQGDLTVQKGRPQPWVWHSSGSSPLKVGIPAGRAKVLGFPLSRSSAPSLFPHGKACFHICTLTSVWTYILRADTEGRFTHRSGCVCVCVHMWVCLTTCNGPAHSLWAQVNPYHQTGQREGVERAGQRIKTQTRTQWQWPLKQFHFHNTPSINCFNSNSAELKSGGTVVGGTLTKWSEDGRKRFLSWVSEAEVKHYDLLVQTSLLLSHSPFLQFIDTYFLCYPFFFTSSWTYVLSSLLKRDPPTQDHGAGTEIHLSIQPSVHSLFLSLCIYNVSGPDMVLPGVSTQCDHPV